jgi:hypothetical protein
VFAARRTSSDEAGPVRKRSEHAIEIADLLSRGLRISMNAFVVWMIPPREADSNQAPPPRARGASDREEPPRERRAEQAAR